MVIPNKVYQCAAVGRPVITADTPAIREVFEPGTTIWLVPPGDAKALADAIALLAEDVCLRERLARQAARFMAEKFSLTRQAERLRDLVEGVAEHD
jgi:glycosyltransferase involved in cell wall biosynthesis